MIISQGLDRNFNLTNDDVRHILELTADDITVYGIGFDEETGYGKVNAHSALALLDEPNELYHGISYGGSTTKTNLSQWIFIGNRWGLSPGTYFDVDRYEVTKHIEFDVPFCSVPEVWIRDRECISMSFANPNDGFPWAEITNVTTTGFDVRYSAYYVRTNILGQTINKWVPSSISSTKIAYTAIGEPNIAGTAGPITGPSIVCTSNTTFTLHNRPPVYSVNWTKSTNLRYVSGQGSDNYIVKAAPLAAGPGWVEATISGDCGAVTVRKDIDWVGVPDPTIDGNEYPECFMREWYFLEPEDKWDTYYWHTDYKLRIIGSRYGYKALVEPLEGGTGQIFCDVTNTCGTGYGRLVVYISCRGFKMSPNPADDYVEISIDQSKMAENNIDEYEVRIYNSMNIMVSQLKTSKPTLRINTRQFITGVYYVHFIFNGKLQVEQLVIGH